MGRSEQATAGQWHTAPEPAEAGPWPSDDYSFLVGRSIDADTLERASSEAARTGVATHEVLIANGWMTASDYARALADECARLSIQTAHDASGTSPRPQPSPGRQPFETSRMIDAGSGPPSWLGERSAALRDQGAAALLLSRDALEWAEPVSIRQARVHAAAHELQERSPALSAGSRVAIWQLVAAPTMVGIAAGGLIVMPTDALAMLAGIVAVPFLFVVGLRILSLAIALGLGGPRGAARRRGTPRVARSRRRRLIRRISARRRAAPRGRTAARVADAELPVYSIMVPMFREAEVLPELVASLAALDYPAAKLDVMLVLESVDHATQAAARAIDPAANVRVVVVPDLAPRTKPKALNYALGLARGEFVVIYDAEDAPEPDQLRLAVAAFRSGPEQLACVQARLNIDNAATNWLTRQFTLEYSALFDALLPALAWLELPVPLGGTSNHFPTEVLRRLGGWDAHNVTEDADLGLRIARDGNRVGVIASTTWEEAPPTFRIWLPQRTRWLKGFMQTWLVHMRAPRRLLAELGLAGFIGFQAIVGGIILSALVYPIFVVLLAVDLVRGEALIVPQSAVGRLMLALAVFNLAGGYLAALATVGVAVARRGYRGMLWPIATMPLYWLLISLAAYRAAVQLVINPYLWEKTPHARRGRGRPRRAQRATRG